MIAPAFPAFRRAAATSASGSRWSRALYHHLRHAHHARGSGGELLRIHDPGVERLQERPKGDFEVGLKVFEDMQSAPATLAVPQRSPWPTPWAVEVVNVVISRAMDRAALDSLAHVLETVRRDSTVVVVTLGYASRLVPLPGRTFK